MTNSQDSKAPLSTPCGPTQYTLIQDQSNLRILPPPHYQLLGLPSITSYTPLWPHITKKLAIDLPTHFEKSTTTSKSAHENCHTKHREYIKKQKPIDQPNHRNTPTWHLATPPHHKTQVMSNLGHPMYWHFACSFIFYY